MKTQYLFFALVIATMAYAVSFVVWVKPFEDEVITQEESEVEDETVVASVSGSATSTPDVWLPKDLPAGIPFYPDAFLFDVFESATNTERTISLTFITDDSIEEVTKWYTDAFATSSWEVAVAQAGLPLTAVHELVRTSVAFIPHSEKDELSITQKIEITASSTDSI